MIMKNMEDEFDSYFDKGDIHFGFVHNKLMYEYSK